MAGFTPHPLVSHFGDFAKSGTANGNDDLAVDHYGFGDLHLESITNAKLFPFCRQWLLELQAHVRARSQNVLRWPANNDGLRWCNCRNRHGLR